jgi:hypothetical protein
MSAADLLPSIQLLPREEKEQLYRFLSRELGESLEPLPDGFPPASDGCPASREELEASRRETGGRSLDEIWRSIGAR